MPTTAASLDQRAARPRRERRHERPATRPTKRTWCIVLTAALASATLATWLANQTPPRVTHAEAMVMAAAIEQAKDLEEIHRLVHFEGVPRALRDPEPEPGGASRGLAATIAFWKHRGSSYTFVETHTDDQGATSLLFRAYRNLSLIEYHELRLARVDDMVKVCDLWSMNLGGWLRSILQERAELFNARETADDAVAFVLAWQSKDHEAMAVAYQRMPPQIRTSRLVGIMYVTSLDQSDVATFRAALADFTLANPEVLALDGRIRLYGSPPAIVRDEALAALDRIKARVGDEWFLRQVREQLLH